MIKFDKLKVTHITIEDKSRMIGYLHIEEVAPKSFLGFKYGGIEQGYYYTFSELSIFRKLKEEDLRDTLTIDSLVYEKPRVLIYINETCVASKYFNKLEQAVKWCQDEFRNIDYSVS